MSTAPIYCQIAYLLPFIYVAKNSLVSETRANGEILYAHCVLRYTVNYEESHARHFPVVYEKSLVNSRRYYQ